MLHQVHTYGTKWAYIASIHTPVRTTLALKNRFSTLRLKSEAKNRQRQGSSSTETSWATQANSIETAMTSPTCGQWSPTHMRTTSSTNNNHHHSHHWNRANDTLKFCDEMDGSGDTEEDDDEGTATPTDLFAAWPSQPHHHHHHHSHQALKVNTTSLPFIQASFANWDAWARLNDAAPSDGMSCHISPVDAAQLSATESYFPLDPSPLMMGSSCNRNSCSSSRPATTASLPSYCFFGEEDGSSSAAGQTTSHADALYPLYGKCVSFIKRTKTFSQRQNSVADGNL